MDMIGNFKYLWSDIVGIVVSLIYDLLRMKFSPGVVDVKDLKVNAEDPDLNRQNTPGRKSL